MTEPMGEEKFRAVVLSVVTVLSVVAGGVSLGPGVAAAAGNQTDVAASNLPGEGTSDNPYQISNASELQAMEDDLSAHYELVSDVNASETGGWDSGNGFDPIGDSGTAFTGTFDGNSSTISDLYVDSSGNAGLFASADDGAHISNLELRNATVSGDGQTGTVVGTFDGVIENVHVSGTVLADGSDSGNAGGVAGQTGTDATYRNSTANVTVTSTNIDDSVGGFLGWGGDESVLSNVSAHGDVTGNASDDPSEYTYDGQKVGGLAGHIRDGSITQSYATGNVTENGLTGDVHDIGGLIGRLEGDGSAVYLNESYATGNVSGGANDIGGLVGRVKLTGNEVYLNDSYATSNISANSDESVGGLIGRIHDNGGAGYVSNSYAVGNVSVTGSASEGGLTGQVDAAGEISESYWDINTTGQDTSAGGATGLTTSQLKANTSLAGFDFTNTWDVVNDSQISYPYLLNNTQSPAPGLATTESGSGDLYAGGSGTESDPYEIANWTHLKNTRENLDSHFELVADLNETTDGYDSVANASANGDKGFDPIGPDYDTPFNGTFDGQGHTIANLTIDRTNEDHVGLFGTAGTNAEITNTSLEDANVTGSDNVGTLVGANDGTVTNSFAAVNLTGTNRVGGLVGVVSKGGTVNMSDATGTVIGDESVGGLVGSTKAEASEPPGNVYASSASSDVTGNRFVGGLVGGLSFGTVTESNSTGAVIGKTNVGGLVGVNQGGSISLSNASGTVAVRDGASSPTNFGGLVGWSFQGTVTQSTATGDVQANDATRVGGLVGYTDATGTSDVVNESYATGNVTGAESVGGLAGTVINATVNQTYATGTVSGDTEVGGLVGNATGANTEVSQSYAVGSVSATGTPVGGLVGTTQDSPTVTDAYWDTETTGVSSSGPGTGLTTSQMIGSDALDSGNMEAFESPPWETVSDGSPPAADADGYPILQALAAEPQIHTPNVESGTENLYAGGSGIKSDPYKIKNWTHLNNTRQNLDANYTLVTDLDENTAGYDSVASSSANNDKGFEPFGGRLDGFSGTFDGQDNTIANLTINRSGRDYVALFGRTDGGMIVNVSLEDVEVTGDKQVGSLVGSHGGGVVSTSSATGTVDGSTYVGGLVGDSYGRVSNSTAAVSVTGSEKVGGLVGQSLGYSTSQGVVNTSHATGTVDGTSYVGGLVGYTSGTGASAVVNVSYATGNVTGTERVGGVAGTVIDATVNQTYAMGSVTGDTAVGGLLGNATGIDTDVVRSYAAGNVTGNSSVGGLVGANEGDATVEDAYWDTERTTQTASAGDAEGHTTSNMTGETALDTMSALDESVWQPVTADTAGADGDGYPVLRSLAIEPQILTVSTDGDTGDETTDTPPEAPADPPATSRPRSDDDDDDDDDRGRSTGGGGATPAPDTGETSVSVTTPADPAATTEATASGESAETGDTATAEEPQPSEESDDADTDRPAPAVSVRVGNPQPGQTLVIEGQTVEILDAGTPPAATSPASATQPTPAADQESAQPSTAAADATGEESADTSTDDDDAASVSNVRADQLAVELATEDDFELSVTTYESDLTPSTAIRSGTPSLASPAAPLRADGFALTNRRFPPGQTGSNLTPSEVQTAATTFQNTTETVAAGYVQIDHTLGPDGMRGGTLSFSIRQAYLEELGVAPERVTLYHQTANGTWTARNTTYVGSDATHHRYTGTMPSFSVFALGTGAPTVDLTEAQLQTPAVAPGESATVTATLENRGQVETTQTVNLTLDGTVVDNVTTTVPATETQTVSMAYVPDQPGSYELAVASTNLKTLTVEPPTETASTSPAEEPAEDDESASPPAAVAILVLVVFTLILGAIAWRRQRSDDNSTDTSR